MEARIAEAVRLLEESARPFDQACSILRELRPLPAPAAPPKVKHDVFCNVGRWNCEGCGKLRCYCYTHREWSHDHCTCDKEHDTPPAAPTEGVSVDQSDLCAVLKSHHFEPTAESLAAIIAGNVQQARRIAQLERQVEAFNSDWHKVISAALRCDPIPAKDRADGNLEPPWEVIDRLKQQRDQRGKDLAEARKVVQELEAMDRGNYKHYDEAMRQLEQDLAAAREENRKLEMIDTAAIDQLKHTLAQRDAQIARLTDGMDIAWGVIANVSGGDWTKETAAWRLAAEGWRDNHYNKMPASLASDLMARLSAATMKAETMESAWQNRELAIDALHKDKAALLKRLEEAEKDTARLDWLCEETTRYVMNREVIDGEIKKRALDHATQGKGRDQ